MGRYVLVLAMCAVLSACGRNTVPNGAVEPRAIVNGIVTNAYPSVVRIRVGTATCTATVVSPTTLVTAAHCTAAGALSYNGVAATSTRSSREGTDLAVAVFPARTLPTDYTSVIDRAPVHNDAIEMVGYGQTDFVNNNPTDGRKRYGRNRLLGFADLGTTTITHGWIQGNFLHYRAPISTTGLAAGDQAMTGRGDSGGPIFINGMLAGAVSVGATRAQLIRARRLENEPTPDNSALYEYDTNLFSAPSIALLRRARTEISAVINGLDRLEAAYRRR